MTLEKTHTEMGRNAKLRNIYISSDRTNLDPGFGRGISGKLFEAPSPLSKLRSTKAFVSPVR